MFMKFNAVIAVMLFSIFISGGLYKTSQAEEKGKAPSITKAKGGYTVEELYIKKNQLDGKKVKVRGKVVKFNPNIMGKNWLHLQDGTGKPGTNDITVTTRQNANLGGIVLVTGVVVTNKDFGGGYRYEVMLDDAAIAAEELKGISYRTSPPTTISGMRRVGWASATGTPCASFPHVPIPNPRSEPSMSIFFKISGPLPARVAPLTGSPTRPFSIK